MDQEVSNKYIFKESSKAFKKNSGLILLICLMNTILYTFVYIVFNALSLPTLAIIGVLIILIFNMLSFKYISYRSLENHPITINDYYFSLRNTLNSFRLGNFTLITGILWGTLGYLIFGGVASIGYIGYLSVFNSSTLTPLISAINTTDANNILEALNKLPYIDIILDTTSLLSILGFAIFFLLKGMSKIFIFYNTFDLHLPLPAAIGISDLLTKSNEKAQNELNFVSLLPIYFVLLGSIGIKLLLVFIGVSELASTAIASFIFFYCFSLLLIKYYYCLGTLYLCFYKKSILEGLNKEKKTNK